MSDSVTLANILGSQVSIQWFEAVAVVREVADRLLTSSNDRAIPELQQIRLSPQGHVDVVGVTPTDEPVRRMGQLLQALVANTDVPVQLRLIITQATAPSPLYASVRDYSDALGFFERPERSTVLSALAARVTAAGESALGDRALTLDSLAPLPTGEKAEEEKKKKSPSPDSQGRSRAWTFAAMAVVILAAAGGGAWYANQRGLGPQNRDEASALAERASESMGTAIVSGASKVTETLGLGRIVPSKEATAPPPAAPPPAAAVKVPPPRRAAADTDTAQPAPPDPPIIAFDLEPSPARARPPAETPVPESSTGSAAAGEGIHREDDAIYTVTSPLIEPPIGIRPKLARQLPPDFDPTRLGRIELIIGVDGLVESAKLLGPPRTVNDGLFLSVAKAWLFQPALKDGMPVRYRKTIWIASP